MFRDACTRVALFILPMRYKNFPPSVIRLSPAELTANTWKTIREKPAFYLGTPSITALRCFYLGWLSSLDANQLEGELLPIPFDIGEWVAYREHFSSSSLGWCGMLLETQGSEDAALARFFTLIDEYACRVPHEFAHIPEVKRENYYGEEDGYHTGRLSLVTYTDDPGFFSRFESPGRDPSVRFHANLESWAKGEEGLIVTDQAEYDRVAATASE